MRRPIRLTLLIVAAVLVVLLLALVVAVYLLLQPQRFTDMLRNEANKAGMQLTLSAPAEPSLWPQPGLVLHGLTLSVHNKPMLIAVRGRLVLPWRTLFGGPVAITRLQLDAPRLDLDLMRTALSQMPGRKGGAPTLPGIEAGISIAHGSLVRGQSLLLDNIRLETGTLAPGQVFKLQLAAATASGKPFDFKLQMTPHTHDGALSFDHVHIDTGSPPNLDASLDGAANWHGGADIAMNLHGTVQHTGSTYTVALQLAPAANHVPFVLGMKLDGPDLHADLRVPPLQLASWWGHVAGNSGTSGLPLPPLDGSIEAAQLDVGNVHVEGLQLRAGDALPSASSAAAPASSTPVPASGATIKSK